jgi:hypothetical protein
MRAQSIGITLFLLSSAVATFGQGTTPTGIVNAGALSLLRSESMIALGTAPPIDATTDNVSGAFVRSDYTNYTPPTLPPITTIGPCVVYTITLPQPTPPPSGLVTTPLDAGPFLNVNGPDGAMQIPQKNSFYYQMVGGGVAIPTPFPIPGLPGVLPPFLDPGSYEVDNGGGGADVGPFMATINVPSPGFLWTNADADLTVTLANGVDIQFTGGDPNGSVSIQGVSSTPTQAGAFTCLVPNNGEYFVPSAVTSMLPATPVGTTAGNTLTVSNTTITNFSAPGLDMGILTYEAGNTRNVVYQ